jgi:hypothetical protein
VQDADERAIARDRQAALVDRLQRQQLAGLGQSALVVS